MSKFTIDNFKLNHKYVIDASAGTGKTHNIMEIVKKLLLEDKNLRLNQILIVTYTEKATGELRNRIRYELVKLLSALESKNGSDTLISKIKEEINDVDSAPIFTIHSFCQNVISEFGLSLNKPLKLDTVAGDQIDKFIDKFIRRDERYELLLKFLSSQTTNSKFLEEVYRGFKTVASNYYLNDRYEEDPTIISFKDAQYDEDSYKYFFASNVNDVKEIFPDLKMHLSTLENSDIEAVRILSNNIQESLLKCFDYKKNNLSAKNVSIKSDPNILEAFNYFDELKKKFSTLRAHKIYISKYLKEFYILWQKEKNKNKSQDFDDMIRTVREGILSGGPIKDRLKEKYVYAIIDEFQDTNQKQFDIFGNLFLNNEKNLIVVGDPKQSIYSFQGADIGVYKKAVEAIKDNGGDIKSLLTNFRSSPKMVETCNELFKYYFSNFSPSEFNSVSLCEKNKPGYIKEYKATFNGKEVEKAFITTDSLTNENKFALTAVEYILSCCEKDENGHTRLRITRNPDKYNEYSNVTYSDFAILGRKRKEFTPIINVLKRAGIPYIIHKDQSLFKENECNDWIILLRAIASNNFTGNKRNLFKKALFTGFFAKSMSEIISEKYNRDDNDEMKLITDWKSLAKDNLWEDLIEDIIMSSQLMNTLSKWKDAASLNKYIQIGDLCIEYLSNGKTLTELINYLTAVIEGESLEDEDSGVIKKSTDSDCVTLMTMHASKGLQFPVVISVSGFSGKFNSESIYKYHDKETSLPILSFEDKDKIQNEEYKEEEKRLYYVALTRPQFILLHPSYEKLGNSTAITDIHKYFQDLKSNRSDLVDTIPVSTSTYKSLADKNNKILKKGDSNKNDNYQNQYDVLSEIIKLKKQTRTHKHSYSTLSHGHDDSSYEENELIFNYDDDIEDISLKEFDLNCIQVGSLYDSSVLPMELPIDYPKGAGLGNALHEVFERIDFTNVTDSLASIIRDRFIRQAISPKDSHIIATKEMVNLVLNAELPEIKGNIETGKTFKLSSIPNKDKKAEMEFNFNFYGEKLKNYLNGFIDLVFKRGEYYSILDWKSDKLSEDEFDSYNVKEDLKKHTDDKYSIQRVLYSYCLINWLKNYYPHLSHEEIFNKHFGGIYYVFLRGCSNKNNSNGVYAQTWSNYKDIEDAFKLIIQKKVRGY